MILAIFGIQYFQSDYSNEVNTSVVTSVSTEFSWVSEDLYTFLASENKTIDSQNKTKVKWLPFEKNCSKNVSALDFFYKYSYL